MSTIAARIQQAYPTEDPGHGVAVTPLRDALVADVRTTILVLFGAVGFVLLIASVSVADLMLARLASRRHEIAVRAALGATRWRITRQMAIEAFALAAVSGTLGVLVAVWAVDLLVGALGQIVPRADEIALDPLVVAFALGVTLLTALLFGVFPALRSAAVDVHGALTERSSSGARGAARLRGALAIAQVAISLILLAGAGLMLKSFWRLQRVDPGFDPTQVLSMTVSLSGTSLGASNEEVIAYYRDLIERVESIPGVVRASGVNALPISGGDSEGQITIEGRALRPEEEPGGSFRRILPGYFETMGIPILEGREFTERDGLAGDSAVIISEAMARRYWPDGGAVGSRIKIGPPEYEPWLTIVGVAGDVHNVGVGQVPGLATYEPHQQRVWRTMNLVVRASGDPVSLAPVIRDEVRRGGLDVPVYDVTTMQMRIRGSLAGRRFNTGLLVAFAVVALMLAVVGLYGVVSYSVAQRTREFGIRVAMGARARDIIATVLREGLVLIGVGVALGTTGALVLTRAIQGMLFDVTPGDPVTYAVVGATLTLVAVVASYVPARRASRVDPMVAIREE
jgi:putative ABC transport system permease protein